MSRCYYFFLAIMLISSASSAQQMNTSRINFGIEQDILPYLTGGYFAGAWVGKDHIRARILTAHVHKPDFIIKDGFTANEVTAYAVLADYFLETGWKGWWAGAGLVYWKSSIRSKEGSINYPYENYFLNGSIGHNWKLYRNIFISPWAGMHLRIGGNKKVQVDNREFNPPLLNPEASIKLSWHIR